MSLLPLYRISVTNSSALRAKENVMLMRNVAIQENLHKALKLESVRRGVQLRDLVKQALSDWARENNLTIEPPAPDPRQLVIDGTGEG